jgi:hypothetical protein
VNLRQRQRIERMLQAVDVFVVDIEKRNRGADNQIQESHFALHEGNSLGFHTVVDKCFVAKSLPRLEIRQMAYEKPRALEWWG